MTDNLTQPPVIICSGQTNLQHFASVKTDVIREYFEKSVVVLKDFGAEWDLSKDDAGNYTSWLTNQAYALWATAVTLSEDIEKEVVKRRKHLGDLFEKKWEESCGK